MSRRSLSVFKSLDELASAAVQRIAAASADAIKLRGWFTVALSGGSLPEILSEELGNHVGKIDFSKWLVFFADERCVPLDHVDSNFRVCDELIFKKVQVERSNVFAVDPRLVGEPGKAAAAYEEMIRTVFRSKIAGGDEQKAKAESAAPAPQFDLLLLGMGPDGHVCSLFPGHALLQESKLLVASLNDSPKPPPARVTVTLPLINAARAALFICTGDGKKDALQKIFELPDSGGLPAGLVRCALVDWLVDGPAAAKLSRAAAL